MFKKLFSFILTVFVLNISILPVFAENKIENNKIVLDTHLVSNINVNKSHKGEIVQFVSNNDYKTEQGLLIPKGTLFNAEITARKQSRFAFRRAKVKIEIKEMVLPDGQKYKVKGNTQRHVYKGSAVGNTVKGIVLTPVALVFGIVGGVVVIVEAVSIVGLLVIGPTTAVVGTTMGKLTKGVNCKLSAGKNIPIKVNLLKFDNYSKYQVPVSEKINQTENSNLEERMPSNIERSEIPQIIQNENTIQEYADNQAG